ncbi:cation diffusion facilitator family transporter [Bacillus massilinigeriensis]|uniref:cation diffusion facilitator family transporter n=1 Tax=Bacillus mediterraneensis TaxID=1805474 RepID=UPI0008F805AC|nr:cation diffusion facilitator family transporter [Bacillus mediterraneensis]
MERMEQIKAGEKGAWISIITYIILAAVKLTAGKISNSEGLWADGLNNSTDIIASIAVLIGLKIAQKPADKDHLYGHYRAESIASLVAAFIMASVGLQVIADGIKSFVDPSNETLGWLSAWIALSCAAAMYGVYRYNLSLGNKINSSSIKAVAYDNRSDALVSIGAFAGIVGTKLGVDYLDTLAAIIVGLIICKTAWSIFYDATHTLTDGFDITTMEDIKTKVISAPGVEEATDIKARMQGNSILVEATILVDPQLTVYESHEIADRIEEVLKRECNVYSATIHIEPFRRFSKN